MRRILLTVVLAIGWASALAHADADSDKAYALASKGKEIGDDGDVAGAIALYKQAIALHDLPTYRCNVGAAYYKLDRWPQAHLILGQCLENAASFDAEYVQSISQVYAFAEKQLRAGEYGTIEFRVTPNTATITVSAFEADESFRAPRTVWLPVGEHRATIEAPNYRPVTIAVVVTASSSQQAEVDLEPTVVRGDDDGDGDGDDDDGDDDDDSDDGLIGLGVPDPAGGPADTARAPSRRSAWISFGIAGAGLLTGVVFHIMAVGTVSELEPLPNGPERDDKVDELNLERGFMFGSYAIGAVAAGLGIYLWTKATRSRTSIALGAAPTGDGEGAMLWLHWWH